MFLLRLLILFLLCYVAFAALRSIVRRGKDGLSGKLNSESNGEDMVLDPQCQSYIPKSNAVAQSGRYFCSRECAQLYLNR
ncbi:MAG: PP0621 family protein [Candidatus Binatia bacterium]